VRRLVRQVVHAQDDAAGLGNVVALAGAEERPRDTRDGVVGRDERDVVAAAPHDLEVLARDEVFFHLLERARRLAGHDARHGEERRTEVPVVPARLHGQLRQLEERTLHVMLR
jgi:hypothetical protein